MSMIAASSPTRGPTTTRGSFAGWRSKSACSVAARSLPTGSAVMAGPVYMRSSPGNGQLQEVGRQVVELGAPRGAADDGLDPPGEPGVERLADQRADPRLGLGADAQVGQARRR